MLSHHLKNKAQSLDILTFHSSCIWDLTFQLWSGIFRGNYVTSCAGPGWATLIKAFSSNLIHLCTPAMCTPLLSGFPFRLVHVEYFSLFVPLLYCRRHRLCVVASPLATCRQINRYRQERRWQRGLKWCLRDAEWGLDVWWMDVWTDKGLNQGVIVAVGVSRREGGFWGQPLGLSAEWLERAEQTGLVNSSWKKRVWGQKKRLWTGVLFEMVGVNVIGRVTWGGRRGSWRGGIRVLGAKTSSGL